MKRKGTRARKRPVQERSRATVEAILEATIRVLLARGYEGTTTIHVAARAGVSVGSLYQYFPNKEALVATLIERHADAFVQQLERVLAEADPRRPEEAIRGVVRASLDAHRLDPALHKVFVEQVPRTGRMAKALDTSRRIVVALERYLEPQRDRLRLKDVSLAAFMVETVIEALTHRAVIEKSDLLKTGKLEAETTAMVLGFLFGPSTAAPPVRKGSGRRAF